MSASNEMIKAQAVIQSHQPSMPKDPDVDRLLNEILVQDTDLMRIFKGDIQIVLDQTADHNSQLQQLVLALREIVNASYKMQLITSVQVNELLVVFKEVEEMLRQQEPLLHRIYDNLSRYFRMVPYLMILSPLTRLSNFTQVMADALKRRVGIMIGRDKLMASGEDTYEDANFWDGTEMTCGIAIQDAVGGWKMQGVVTEKRQVSTIIDDRSAQQRKKKFGFF